MKATDRKKRWARLDGKVSYMGDNFPHIIAEIDRAVRKAKREERKRMCAIHRDWDSHEKQTRPTEASGHLES